MSTILVLFAEFDIGVVTRMTNRGKCLVFASSTNNAPMNLVFTCMEGFFEHQNSGRFHQEIVRSYWHLGLGILLPVVLRAAALQIARAGFCRLVYPAFPSMATSQTQTGTLFESLTALLTLSATFVLTSLGGKASTRCTLAKAA